MGGVNYSDDIFSVRSDQIYRAVNCHLSESGVLFTRKGSRRLNSTALSYPITSIYDYRRPDGSGFTQTLLVTAGKHLYRWDTETSTFIELRELVGSTRPVWATFLNGLNGSLAFMCNGEDFISYDGTTVRDITFVTGISKPRYIEVYDDRMLATGCDSDPYKVFISAALDGTDWLPGAESTAVYWTMSGASGDAITSIKSMYSYCVIFQKNAITIITGADPDDTTNVQIPVCNGYGTSSHWSVQVVGDTVYFANSAHICRGYLRAAIENGLVVKPIDRNIFRKYRDARTHGDIVSVYDAVNEEIQWGVDCLIGTPATDKDTSLIYSVRLSMNIAETADISAGVWSGWFEGANYKPYTLSGGLDSTGKPIIYRGDTSGYVYVMDETMQFKDHETDIPTTIVTGAILPNGYSVAKCLRHCTLALSQFYNESTTLQFVVDGSYLKPSTSITINLKNNIPYHDEADDVHIDTSWGNSIWVNNAYIVAPVSTLEPFRYIQLIIYNAGANARDYIRYAGCELAYQFHGIMRQQGT